MMKDKKKSLAEAGKARKIYQTVLFLTCTNSSCGLVGLGLSGGLQLPVGLLGDLSASDDDVVCVSGIEGWLSR